MSGDSLPGLKQFDPCYTFLDGRQVLDSHDLERVSDSVQIYKRMGVTGIYHGRHMRDADIRKPISAFAIPEKCLVALIHNGRLISLIDCLSRKILETFVVRDPVNYSTTRGLRGELVADNSDYLYVTSEGAVAIFRFRYTTVKDPTNVQPDVFATVPENASRLFRGMAISLAQRLFFTAYGREIFGFSLTDGTLMARWELGSEDLTSALIQSAVDMHIGRGIPPKLFLVATTLGGSKLHGKLLKMNGEPDKSEFQQIGKGIHGGIGQVRHCTFDASGNLIAVDSKRQLIHVFPPTPNGTIISFAPPEEDDATGEWISDLKNETVRRVFNPSGISIVSDPSSRIHLPLVVVPDFSLDAVLFLSPELE